MMAANVFRPGLFAGKTALVTGGGTGIGFAIARTFGQLGAKVVIAARAVERLEQAAQSLADDGIDALALPVNIRDEASVRALFDSLVARERVPDILVNNAGGQFASPALDITANGFRSVVDLNLNGTWHVSSAFTKAAMAAGKPGRIVNIVLVVDSGIPGMVHAAASRAGVVAMTKTLAYEWAPHGITVNAVAPGTVETEGLANYEPASLAAAVERLPIKRMASTEDVAAAVVFLAGPGGDYVTGTVLHVDGGEHLIGCNPQVAARAS